MLYQCHRFSGNSSRPKAWKFKFPLSPKESSATLVVRLVHPGKAILESVSKRFRHFTSRPSSKTWIHSKIFSWKIILKIFPKKDLKIATHLHQFEKPYTFAMFRNCRKQIASFTDFSNWLHSHTNFRSSTSISSIRFNGGLIDAADNRVFDETNLQFPR